MPLKLIVGLGALSSFRAISPSLACYTSFRWGLALGIDQSRAAVILGEGNQRLRADGLTFHPNVLEGFLCVGVLLGRPLIKK